MGVVNVTPDSFSDGGAFDDAAQADRPRPPAGGRGRRDPRRRRRVHPPRRRPGAGRGGAAARRSRSSRASRRRARLDRHDEARRWREAAVEAGATYVNDVTAFRHDPDLAGFVADRGLDCCLMHMLGEPRTMQADPRYVDVVSDVKAFLTERMEFAVARRRAPRSGSSSTPGSASARRSSTTSSCCGACDELTDLGRPLVIGTSRKSFLGRLTGRDVTERVHGDRRHLRDRARARGERVPRPRRGRGGRRAEGGGCYVRAAWPGRARRRLRRRGPERRRRRRGGPRDRGHRSRSSDSRSTRTTASPRPSARSGSGWCSTSASTSASRTR